MLGRSGSWVGTSVAGTIRARFWYYQDFPAGSASPLTITQNDNGTGGDPFDSANIVNSSAVAADVDGNPIFANAAELPADLVKVIAHTGTNVDLNQAPAVSEGPIRIWYLYAVSSPGAPLDLEIAPRFVTEVRSEFLDNRYLNHGLNLSDLTDPVAARLNLGFVAQTAGRVLLGDGSTTFTSDSDLFFDTPNTRLGIGTSTPGYQLHLLSTAGAAVAAIESQSTSNAAILMFKASRTAAANLAVLDVASRQATLGMFNAAYGDLAFTDVIYQGNGTTQKADIAFSVANLGAPAEVFRIEAAGTLKTSYATGAAYIDAQGRLQVVSTVDATELGYLDGVTSGIQAQLNGKQATGNYITALTSDVTASGPGSVAATIANNAVTNAKAADMATATFKGRTTAGTGDPEDLSATQATALLNVFVGDSGAGGTKGLVPAPATGDAAAGKYLKADGTWSALLKPKSGKYDLADGDMSKAVVFNTSVGAPNALLYTPVVSFRDTVSTDPLYLPYTIIAQDENGFTAEWNDPIIGNNVDLLWGILLHDNP